MNGINGDSVFRQSKSTARAVAEDRNKNSAKERAEGRAEFNKSVDPTRPSATTPQKTPAAGQNLARAAAKSATQNAARSADQLAAQSNAAKSSYAPDVTNGNLDSQNAQNTAKASTEALKTNQTSLETAKTAQSAQKIRPETQDAAARQDQGSKFIADAKKGTEGLRNLENRVSDGRQPSTGTATKTAVAGKDQNSGANSARKDLGKDDAAATAKKSQETADKDSAKQPARDKVAQMFEKAGLKAPVSGSAEDAARAAMQDAPQNAHVAAQSGQAQGATASDGGKPAKSGSASADSKTAAAGKKRSGGTKSFTLPGDGNITARESGKGLGELLRGSREGYEPMTGEADEELAEGSADVRHQTANSADVRHQTANSADVRHQGTGFKVFNEFDSEVEGIGELKERALQYAGLEKRLDRIEKIDGETDETLGRIFNSVPFSERIVGELAGEVKLARFLGSVYGEGVCRG